MDPEHKTQLLLCGKCSGTGQYLRYGECFECRGSGVMCSYENGIITFQGIMYVPGMELQFYNTRSKIDVAVVHRFYNSDVPRSYPGRSFEGSGLISLNKVWFEFTARTTGNVDFRPLHISLDIAGVLKRPVT